MAMCQFLEAGKGGTPCDNGTAVPVRFRLHHFANHFWPMNRWDLFSRDVMELRKIIVRESFFVVGSSGGIA